MRPRRFICRNNNLKKDHGESKLSLRQVFNSRQPIRKRGKYPAVQFAKNMHRHTQKKIQTDVATCSRRPTTSEPTQRRAFSPTHGRLASTAAQNRNGQACAVSRHAQACTVARKRITAEFTV